MSAYGNPYNYSTNPVITIMSCGSMHPSLDFYYDGTYKTWWERWGKTVFLAYMAIQAIGNTIAACLLAVETCGAAVPLVAVSVTMLKIILNTAIGTTVSLAISGIISGMQSKKRGHGFWDGFSDAVTANFAEALITNFYFASLGVLINNALQCVQCFKEGTLIQTDDGLKPIEEIEVGDYVLAYNEETGEQEYKEVVRLFRNETTEWYRIRIEHEEITCTGGHPFYVPAYEKFVPARDLEHIALPNELNYYPLTDVNGRNTGKELKNANNNNIYAEYIYYLKEGDHGTNMPSSVYFGKNKNNRFSVSDNIKYKYDEMCNISEVRENGVLTAKYTYDRIGRLVREDNRKFGKSIFISYDNCGNILSKREAQFTLKPTDEIEIFTEEKMYCYNGDKLLSFGDEILFYTDTEGKEHVNPVIYRGHDVTWNFGRQLASFGDNVFAYDGYGRRIRKNDTVFTYDANNKLVKQSDGENTLEFIYDNSGISGIKLAKRVGDNVEAFEYIYSKDVQGNVVGLLDKSGKEVVKYAYDAWGNHKVLDSNGTENTDENFIGNLNPFRYRSYYYDRETHLYYLNTRYYDPETGRFISQDDVSYLDPEHVNGLNLFAYCGNNPVMGYDPDGTLNWLNIFGCILVAFVATAAVVGGIIASVASFGAATPAVAFGWAVLGGALIGFGTAMASNMHSQIQSKGWGNVDLIEVAIVGVIGATIGAATSAISFGVGQIAKGIGQTFGYLLSNTKISGLLVSKVFSTSLLTNAFGSIGSAVGGAAATFLGDYMGNSIFYSTYTKNNAKETSGSIFLNWVLEFFSRFFYN